MVHLRGSHLYQRNDDRDFEHGDPKVRPCHQSGLSGLEQEGMIESPSGLGSKASLRSRQAQRWLLPATLDTRRTPRAGDLVQGAQLKSAWRGSTRA